MLNQPTIEALKTLKLSGMVKALEEQLANPELQSLTFEERLGLLVDREYIDQENRLMSRRLQRAKLGQSAVLEDIDLRTNRGLEKSMVAGFASCNWIRDHRCVRMNPWKVGSKA